MKRRSSLSFSTLFPIPIIAVAVLIFYGSCSKDSTSPVQEPAQQVPPAPTGIVYTNVGSDSVIIDSSRRTYNLDLDKDGNNDVTIITSEGRCGGDIGIMVKQIALNVLGGSVSADHGYFASALDSAAVIDAGSDWANNQGLLRGAVSFGYIRCMISLGTWYNKSDKYLGVKFTHSENTYYGWLRLSSSYDVQGDQNHGRRTITGQIRLKGYAYNSDPNRGIIAGQTK